MINILNSINKLLWGIVTFWLIISGCYFSKKLSFLQFNIKDMIKGFQKDKNNKISPFETLMLTLGARIGVGSLAGVALAIYIGGPGTVFWMWIATIIVAPNAYMESYLGVLYHEKEGEMYQGGPSYYISKGINKKNLSKIYSYLVIIAYIFGFLTIQSNTIARSFQEFNNISPIITGISLSILTGFIIVKGAKGIINVLSKLMPFIGILYVIFSVYVIIANVELLPNVLKLIIDSALNFKSFGMGIFSSFIIGFQRSIFSNEAGVGSGAIAAATVDNNDAKGQGMIQILGVYFTTLVLCTLTAFIILLSNYTLINTNDINGIEITQYAFNYHLGTLGDIVLLIIVFVFAFSTIISAYYYGENSLKFLRKNTKKRDTLILQVITVILLVIGSITNSMFLWNIVDILIAIMGIINIYALFKLRNKVN